MKVPYSLIGNILIAGGVIYIFLGFWPVLSAEAWYFFTSTNYRWSSNTQVNADKLLVNPVDTEFSLIIPKINVNTPVIPNTSVTDEKVYLETLKHGVAHAQNSQLPGDVPGNTYLFAHSTPNIFDIQKYSASFTLLNKLKENDRVIIVYKEQIYLYTVIGNEVVGAFNLNPLTRTSDHPILTLQTCDPPGVPLNRRIVTAVLEKVEPYKEVSEEHHTLPTPTT